MITAFFDGVYLLLQSQILDEFFAMCVVAGAVLVARRIFRREV